MLPFPNLTQTSRSQLLDQYVSTASRLCTGLILWILDRLKMLNKLPFDQRNILCMRTPRLQGKLLQVVPRSRWPQGVKRKPCMNPVAGPTHLHSPVVWGSAKEPWNPAPREAGGRSQRKGHASTFPADLTTSGETLNRRCESCETSGRLPAWWMLQFFEPLLVQLRPCKYLQHRPNSNRNTSENHQSDVPRSQSIHPMTLGFNVEGLLEFSHKSSGSATLNTWLFIHA